jgi:hypothetical protein
MVTKNQIKKMRKMQQNAKPKNKNEQKKTLTKRQ